MPWHSLRPAPLAPAIPCAAPARALRKTCHPPDASWLQPAPLELRSRCGAASSALGAAAPC
eukprot:6755707-Alexandrium_andersonii.AAC.1